MIVEDDGEPGPRRFTVRVHDEDIERRMICLPKRVGRFGAVTVNKFIAIAKSRGTLLRERLQRRIEIANYGVDGRIRWSGKIFVFGDFSGLAVECGDRRARFTERQPFNKRGKIGGQLPFPASPRAGRARPASPLAR